jgi:hypothetical protein
VTIHGFAEADDECRSGSASTTAIPEAALLSRGWSTLPGTAAHSIVKSVESTTLTPLR